MSRLLHPICLLLGSNIGPEHNLPQAVNHLRNLVTVLQTSSVWESPAVGSKGPPFLNAAVHAMTAFDSYSLKGQVIRPLEARMGRVRTKDKNAPRTIDIDLILFDEQLMDPSLYHHAHLAVPMAEILPDYKSDCKEPLKDVAEKLASITPIKVREGLSCYPFATIFYEAQ